MLAPESCVNTCNQINVHVSNVNFNDSALTEHQYYLAQGQVLAKLQTTKNHLY